MVSCEGDLRPQRERKEGEGKTEEKNGGKKKSRKRGEKERQEERKNAKRKGGRQGANGISHRAVLMEFPQDGLTDVLLG